MSTGLSIKTLAEALCEVAGNWGWFSRDKDTPEGLEAYRRERDFAFRLRAALCAKSERYAPLERVAAAAAEYRTAEQLYASLLPPHKSPGWEAWAAVSLTVERTREVVDAALAALEKGEG